MSEAVALLERPEVILDVGQFSDPAVDTYGDYTRAIEAAESVLGRVSIVDVDDTNFSRTETIIRLDGSTIVEAEIRSYPQNLGSVLGGNI